MGGFVVVVVAETDHTTIFRRMLVESVGRPTEISVVKQYITHHAPFVFYTLGRTSLAATLMPSVLEFDLVEDFSESPSTAE
jgi:hypothetical protein